MTRPLVMPVMVVVANWCFPLASFPWKLTTLIRCRTWKPCWPAELNWTLSWLCLSVFASLSSGPSARYLITENHISLFRWKLLRFIIPLLFINVAQEKFRHCSRRFHLCSIVYLSMGHVSVLYTDTEIHSSGNYLISCAFGFPLKESYILF